MSELKRSAAQMKFAKFNSMKISARKQQQEKEARRAAARLGATTQAESSSSQASSPDSRESTPPSTPPASTPEVSPPVSQQRPSTLSLAATPTRKALTQLSLPKNKPQTSSHHHPAPEADHASSVASNTLNHSPPTEPMALPTATAPAVQKYQHLDEWHDAYKSGALPEIPTIANPIQAKRDKKSAKQRLYRASKPDVSYGPVKDQWLDQVAMVREEIAQRSREKKLAKRREEARLKAERAAPAVIDLDAEVVDVEAVAEAQRERNRFEASRHEVISLD